MEISSSIIYDLWKRMYTYIDTHKYIHIHIYTSLNPIIRIVPIRWTRQRVPVYVSSWGENQIKIRHSPNFKNH